MKTDAAPILTKEKCVTAYIKFKKRKSSIEEYFKQQKEKLIKLGVLQKEKDRA